MKTLLFIATLTTGLYCQANETQVATPAKEAPVVHHVELKSEKNYAEIIEDLREGNRRFMSGQAKHPMQDASTRQSLAKGQAPNAIILSCSDSRVPTELIFDKGIGEIFVVRNAGNIAESISIASIEYAVEHLGSKVLVVMGHDSCGAVKATLGSKKGHSAGSPNLDLLVKNIEGNLSYSKGFSRDPEKASAAITANVRGVVATLMKRSKIIREFVAQNKLIIVQAYYHFDTGEAELLEIGRPLMINLEEKPKSAEERSPEGEAKSYRTKSEKEFETEVKTEEKTTTH